MIHEDYNSQAQVLRVFLESTGFRKDNRCKKWETWKKTVDGTIHRVKFGRMTFSFDWFNRGAGARGAWRQLRSMHYARVTNITDLEFISPLEMSDEDREVNEYLERIGA